MGGAWALRLHHVKKGRIHRSHPTSGREDWDEPLLVSYSQPRHRLQNQPTTSGPTRIITNSHTLTAPTRTRGGGKQRAIGQTCRPIRTKDHVVRRSARVLRCSGHAVPEQRTLDRISPSLRSLRCGARSCCSAPFPGCPSLKSIFASACFACSLRLI